MQPVGTQETQGLFLLLLHGSAIARHVSLGRLQIIMDRQYPTPTFPYRHGFVFDQLKSFQNLSICPIGGTIKKNPSINLLELHIELTHIESKGRLGISCLSTQHPQVPRSRSPQQASCLMPKCLITHQANTSLIFITKFSPTPIRWLHQLEEVI